MTAALESSQILFAAALVDGASLAALLPQLAPDDTRTAARMALYRGNLAAVWEKALVEAYPVVRQLVGEEFFDALACAYGRAIPSRSGDLNVFGDRFAQFVSTFPQVQSMPWLADVARLEWAVHRAHYAADAPAIDRAHLAALTPEELLATRFSLHPATAWVESRFPVATLWRAHQAQSNVALPDTLDRAEQALIVRPQWRVQVLSSSAAEIAALTCLRDDAPMAAMIKMALQLDAQFDFTAALLRWLDFGVLADPPTQ